MKLKFIIFVVILSCISSHAKHLIFPLLRLEGQSNIVVTADSDYPQLCPPEYTNLLSNTNLFSLAEQKKLKEVVLKYQNVTTNAGPTGSVFKGWLLARTKYAELGVPKNTFRVACFTYTNSGAQEEIHAYAGPKYIEAKFRTPAGDGYDVVVINNILITYQEYRHGVLDGLFVVIGNPNHPEEKQHCGLWTRFVNGKATGKFIVWQKGSLTDEQAGVQIVAEAEFKKPFDFLKYQSIPIDLTWDQVPKTTTK